MTKGSANLQDNFLNYVRRQNRSVLIVLTNGDQFQGQVTGFDNFTVVVSSEGKRHLVYKHAIAQLVSDEVAEEKSDEPRRPKSERNGHTKSGEKKAESQARPDGFNTLDLSSVRLSAASEDKSD